MADLTKFKGKQLDDTLFAELQAAFDAQDEARQAAEDKAKKAVKESIDGRKAKDARIERLSELLGVEADADLDKIDVKGMAEAAKQVEAKLKKLERDLADKTQAHDELSGKYAAERRQRAIAQAVAKHDFIDSDDAASLLGMRIKEDGDELKFDAGDGKLVPLADGAAWLAKTKPHLVKPAGGSGGSGARPGGAKSGEPPKKPERKDYPDDLAFVKAEAAFFRAQQGGNATH